MSATINELVTEVINKVTELPQFRNKGFSVYDLDDAETVAENITLPMVGVSYEGCEPLGGSYSYNPTCKSVVLYTIRVSLIIALEYASAAASVNSKEAATDLLDASRASILGLKGVNNRPWRFVGEAPISGKLEGVIFYGQIWETDVSLVGT